MHKNERRQALLPPLKRSGFPSLKNCMIVNLKKLHPDAVIPTQPHAGNAGYDLYACNIPGGRVSIMPHKTVAIGTGLAMEIPEGYVALILPRSGMASKRGLRPANTPGLIDPIYRGEFICAMHNDSEKEEIIENGDRIAQLMIAPYVCVKYNEVDELSETERGPGGFGSSGIK